MAVTVEIIKTVLSKVFDPNTHKDLVSLRAIKDIRISDKNVSIELELGYPAKSQIPILTHLIKEALKQVEDINQVDVVIRTNIVSHAAQRGIKLLPNIKNIIAIASGKGGVGKSTTAVNIALALSAEGAAVGILDADIYGPSQPTMMGLSGRPESQDGTTIEPLEHYGVQVSSIGFMVDPGEPMVWRGPMVTQALQQLLMQTNWRDLDYLIIDMPPGTGDIQLTLSQKIPVTGAVIVTTPQDIALLDARRGLKMFEKVGIPILGIIENMSTHVCTGCGHIEPIFGVGGGEKMCAEYDVSFLGALPLTLSIRQDTDAGMPTVVADPNGSISTLYKEIARKIAVDISERMKDTSHKFPKIIVQHDA